jgi:hypothetical protein
MSNANATRHNAFINKPMGTAEMEMVLPMTGNKNGLKKIHNFFNISSTLSISIRVHELANIIHVIKVEQEALPANPCVLHHIMVNEDAKNMSVDEIISGIRETTDE